MGAIPLLVAIPVLQASSLAGTVVDALSGRPVPLAAVTYVTSVQSFSALSRSDGSFVLPAGDRGRLVVEAPGYETIDTLLVRVANVVISMRPLPLQVEGVTVEGHRAAPATKRVFDRAAMEGLPVSLGRDVARIAGTSAAASTPSDYSSAISIRGGATSQSSVFVDGIRLFNPMVLGGALSALSASSLSFAELGGSEGPPSSEGGSAGDLYLYSQDGSAERMGGHASIGLLDSGLHIDGPVPGMDATFLVNGRRSYLDVASRGAEAVGLTDRAVPYHFGTVLGKLSFGLRRQGRLRLTAVRTSEELDRLSIDDGAESLTTTWTSEGYVLNVSDILPGGVVVQVRGGISRFAARGGLAYPTTAELEAPVTGRLRMSEGSLAVSARRAVGVVTVGVGAEWATTAADHALRVSDSTFLAYVPDLEVAADQRRWLSVVSAEASVFGGRGYADAGVLFVNGSSALTGAITYDRGVGPVRASATLRRTADVLYSLRDEESFLSSLIGLDVRVPGGPADPLPSTLRGDLSVEAAGERADGSITLFGRRTHRLRLPPVAAISVDGPLLREPVELRMGSERALGFEVHGAMTGRAGRVEANLSRVWVERAVADLTFTPRTGSGWELNVVAAGRRGSSTFKLAFTGRSGVRYSPLLGTVALPVDGDAAHAGLLPVWGRMNATALAPYLRVDLGWEARYRWRVLGRDGEIVPYVTVVNAFNRRNPLRASFSSVGTPRLTYAPQLPVLPFIGLRWVF